MESLKSLFRSFGYAFRGIFRTLAEERNMRIHAVCMVYMYTFLAVYDFFAVTRAQLALLFLANALVVAAELVNTAVQHAVDLAADAYRLHAKRAKDAAAGAVLVCAAFAVAVGVAVLGQREAFRAMFAYYKENPWMLAVLAFSIALATVFIFRGFGKRFSKSEEEDRL